MALKPLYIFDLDGTLALIDHRRHLVSDKTNQRWDEFYRACINDQPNRAVITIFNALIYASDQFYENYNIKIFSGRSDIVRKETEEWLEHNTEWGADIELRMRQHGDNTPDEALKKQWYDELSQEGKDHLICVFDDRQKVVDMWRSIGVTCLQVAKGDF